MSGHSKWNNIKRKKEKTDGARAKVFTKIGREISVAVRDGGPNPASNSKLADLIAKAKRMSVPNDNIQRIIKKAEGGDKTEFEAITYEGYGPGGVAVMVETLTDNRNRTAADLRHYFDKNGGNLGAMGCVGFLFSQKGVIDISLEDKDADEAMMDALDAGAEDFDASEDAAEITTDPENYSAVVKAMEEKGVGRPSTYASIISTIQDRDYVIKKDKRLAPTPLGEVVNGLMMERFNDIIDVEFTANMENRLDDVEEGKRHWQDILRDFYKGFHQEMEDAEEALKDTRLKVPDEETDVVCELCGLKMVIKMGGFGRFMACPGYPECKNTKPIVERMPGRCPKCGSGMLKRKSKKGFAYYACERGAACGFMTWDVPTEFDCPSCGQTMFKKSGRGRMKPFCINEACSNFLPEDQRGYRRKTAEPAQGQEAEQSDSAPVSEVPAENSEPKKKTAGKKKKSAAAAKTAKENGEAQT